MKIAILSRPGPCFPSIISEGLQQMLQELNIESNIHYNGISVIMRLLPMNEKPRRWKSNFQFRIRDKLWNYFSDRRLLNELKKCDAIVISECYPNAFWRDYFAIATLKKIVKGKVISYTEGPLDSAPGIKQSLLSADDYPEDIYDYNLFVSELIEVRKKAHPPRQYEIGMNIIYEGFQLNKKTGFTALIDFAQPGFEQFREQQKRVLKKLNIPFIELEGKYQLDAIRQLYQQASVFFLAFPESIGLPIAECLASGTYIFVPDEKWPMAWRLPVEECPSTMMLPDCFKVYHSDRELEFEIHQLSKGYDVQTTPRLVFDTFIKHYSKFYKGNISALNNMCAHIKADAN